MHRNQTLGNFEKEIKIKIDAEKIANIIPCEELIKIYQDEGNNIFFWNPHVLADA